MAATLTNLATKTISDEKMELQWKTQFTRNTIYNSASASEPRFMSQKKNPPETAGPHQVPDSCGRFALGDEVVQTRPRGDNFNFSPEFQFLLPLKLFASA